MIYYYIEVVIYLPMTSMIILSKIDVSLVSDDPFKNMSENHKLSRSHFQNAPSQFIR